MKPTVVTDELCIYLFTVHLFLLSLYSSLSILSFSMKIRFTSCIREAELFFIIATISEHFSITIFSDEFRSREISWGGKDGALSCISDTH